MTETVHNTMINRRSTLGFSMFINLCIGFGYAWSIFAGPLIQIFGWELTEVSITFTISNIAFTVMTIVGGTIQDRYGPVLAIRIGACLLGGGIFLCGFTNSLLWLYICYGIISSSGTGLIYCSVLMNINKCYPDKKGFASGLITACYGFSAVIFSPVSTFLIHAFGLLNAFRILGGFFFLALMTASFFVRKAPPLDRNPHWVSSPGERTLQSETSRDKTWIQMIRTPLFYVIFFLMVIGSAAGLMIIGQASVLARDMIGVSVTKAAFTVSCITGANALGRIVWGVISDRIGRNTALHFVYLISALMMFELSFIQEGQYLFFAVLAMLIAFCYGGIMGTFPALVTEHFGAKNNGTNYGIILLGVGIGSFIGPFMAAWTQSLTPGDYSLAFYISATLSICGILLTFILRKMEKK